MTDLVFTGRIYKCPECGREIEGYTESNVYPDEYAGCAYCLDVWKAQDLKQISKEIVVFT